MTGILPWLLPGVVLSILLGLVLARPLGRSLGARTWVAFLLIVSLGAVLFATLPPDGDGLLQDFVSASGCEVARYWPASMGTYLSPNEASLNVLLFIPLGISIGLLPPSRTAVAVVVLALALPFAIEAIQLLVHVLGRGCETADIVDNLIGLALGFGAARLAVSVGARMR